MPGVSRGPGLSAWRRLGLAWVRGVSMEPTLREGDLLLVRYGARPRPGLVIVRLPDGQDGPRPVSVKRLTGTDPSDPTRWWVERDNPRVGVDSWTIGGLATDDVLARVIARLPRWFGRIRAGRLG